MSGSPLRPPPRSPEEAVRRRTIWQSYAALPAQTRLRISIGICAVALAGIFISDRLEEAVPPPKPTSSAPNPDSL
ncbi:hypothetical protein OF83DRAFT_1167127 [Amylostereum chailletii]|nr:hypothetical protein OF83DRAFT_1167127 [Amylostereum chailletii]